MSFCVICDNSDVCVFFCWDWMTLKSSRCVLMVESYLAISWTSSRKFPLFEDVLLSSWPLNAPSCCTRYNAMSTSHVIISLFCCCSCSFLAWHSMSALLKASSNGLLLKLLHLTMLYHMCFCLFMFLHFFCAFFPTFSNPTTPTVLQNVLFSYFSSFKKSRQL